MAFRIGIDLGTTFSAVAIIDPVTGQPTVIENTMGEKLTPSVLCFVKDEETGEVNILFGKAAKERQAAGDQGAVAFFKRNMGNDYFEVEFFGKTYNAEDLSSILLEKLKEDAEKVLGDKISEAVITVPAYFAHKERLATMRAGERAGLKVTAIINEPSAATFAYGLASQEEDKTVLIYDLGGGTFDVTAAHITKTNIDILGSDGDHELGGKDWDDCIARHLAAKYEEETEIDITENPEDVAALLVIAEEIKKKLSEENTTIATIGCERLDMSVGSLVQITTDIEIDYATFDELTRFLTQQTKDVTESLISTLSLEWSDFDGIIFVGGSTRMRMIIDYVKELSGKEPLYGINADEAVALGAAIRANIGLDGKILPDIGGQKVAFVQGAKAISDVTAHSLGMIALSDDGEKYTNSIIIKKNSKIPAKETKPFKITTHAKELGLNELEIYILQGEFDRVLDNTIINKYVVRGIEPCDPPESIIEVTYRYTENGIIEVSAIQRENEKQLSISEEKVPTDMSWTDQTAREIRRKTGAIESLEVILAVDLSGSMAGEPTICAQDAMKNFVDKMNNKITKIGVVAFADEVEILQNPESDFSLVKDKINMLRFTDVGAGNAALPFDTCKRMFKNADSQFIIILTDGVWLDPAAAVLSANALKTEGIDIMALGFGSADEKFLHDIASVDEFASFTDIANLSVSFSKIAQVISSGSEQE